MSPCLRFRNGQRNAMRLIGRVRQFAARNREDADRGLSGLGGSRLRLPAGNNDQLHSKHFAVPPECVPSKIKEWLGTERGLCSFPCREMARDGKRQQGTFG